MRTSAPTAGALTFFVPDLPGRSTTCADRWRRCPRRASRPGVWIPRYRCPKIRDSGNPIAFSRPVERCCP
ncbi:hypothetical protein [Haladaptatus cibarius]|uniref:hypothetical protein n=1 Tax=Haladaptatus cibarius TaxID=453847 RepID=UPI00130E18DD|nr:hypothetical protein [Haladaptatus cibarius]